MNRQIFKYILLTGGTILLGIQITEMDFNNLPDEKYLGILSNLLLIVAMIISIRHTKKQEKS